MIQKKCKLVVVEQKNQLERPCHIWTSLLDITHLRESSHIRDKFSNTQENIARVAKSCPKSWSVVKVLKCFLLKDVIITTSVTIVIFITIPI